MKKPYIVAINSVSGGGKTALAKLLAKSLPSSVVFCFDDFDETERPNVYPPDFYQWWKRGADLEEFDSPGMGEVVGNAMTRGLAEYIIMDYPFGRDHSRFHTQIDLSVYVDTPLDVAMARRIIRDFNAANGDAAPAVLARLHSEMDDYLKTARHVYLDTERHRSGSDLVLDGCRSLHELTEAIIEHIQRERRTAG
jgi:uridine kinase